MRHRQWFLIGGAPLLLILGYWLVIDHRLAMLDWTVLAVAVGVGLFGIWSAPWRRGAQLVASVVYVPVMGAIVGAIVLLLECSEGNCL